MERIPKFQLELRQNGNYLSLFDYTDYAIQTHTRSFDENDVVLCVIANNIETNVATIYSDLTEVDGRKSQSVYLNTLKHYEVWAYLVPKWNMGAVAPGSNVYWHDGTIGYYIDNVFQMAITPSNYDIYMKPPYIQEELIHTYLFMLLDEQGPSNNLYTIEKTGKHMFNINYVTGSGLIQYKVKDFAGHDLVEWTFNESNTIRLAFSEDDLYKVLVLRKDNNGKIIGQEEILLYDMSDIEDCYQIIVDGLMCYGIDGCQCTGKNYDKALQVAALYTSVRDIAYSDNAMRCGLLSAEEYNEDYITKVGTIIRKLKIITDPCLCKE